MNAQNKFTVLDLLTELAKGRVGLSGELMVRIGSDRIPVRIAATYESNYNRTSWSEVVPDEDAVQKLIQNKAETMCQEMARNLLKGHQP